MEALIEEYHANAGRKLHKIVDKILKKFGGLSEKDKDDFYSAASFAIAEAWKKGDYDEAKGTMEGYLYRIINFAILSELRDRNRFRRSNTRPKRDKNGEIVCENGKIRYEFISDISLDTPIGEDGGTVGDLISDSILVEDIVFTENLSIKAEKYLEELPCLAGKIIQLKITGYDKNYIINLLQITSKQYVDAMETMKSSEYISILL